MKIPTFDEWFEAKSKLTFEEAVMVPGSRIDVAMKKLTEEVRHYMSDVAKLVVKAARANKLDGAR